MINLKPYTNKFSESKFWNKCKAYLKPLGLNTMYTTLLLYYAYQREETPYWAKHIVLGALGYLIAPIDAIPDLSPIIGYTDDMGILSFGLITIACHVNMDVKINARQQLKKWFGPIDVKELESVDKKL